MSDIALAELARRVRARRTEANYSVLELATAALVPAAALEAFERGAGQLGVGALMRLARALGVPEESFIHTSVAEATARAAPAVRFASGSPQPTLHEVDLLALRRYVRNARALASIAALRRQPNLCAGYEPRVAPKSKAYAKGYDLAASVRTAIGDPSGPLRGLGPLIEDRFSILVARHQFRSPEIRAVAVRSADARLIVVSTGISDQGRARFLLAHELCHHLVDLSGADAIAEDIDETGPLERSPAEQRANAFAAMLLAPRAGVAAILGNPRKALRLANAADAIASVRHAFGLSFDATAWHLFALLYLDCLQSDLEQWIPKNRDTADVVEFEPSDSPGLLRQIALALSEEAITQARARELLGSESVQP